MNPIRIAMWSGPRNISTAMMRSWENRSDTMVVDEPLYGPYLFKTHKKHPMHAEIIKDQGAEYDPIISQLTQGNLVKNKAIYYQKHMCHHIIEDMDITWVKHFKNAFLIRNPKSVLASYIKKHNLPTAYDLGYPQQLKIFNYIKENCGYKPVVMEAKDILNNPRKMLAILCKNLSVKFDESMLSWAKGYRESDGIWAPRWYNRVIESTGFSEYKHKEIELNLEQKTIVEDCLPYYEALKDHKITC